MLEDTPKNVVIQRPSQTAGAKDPVLSENPVRVAIITEWLDSWGGAEYVALVLHEMFPEAPIFTAVYNPNKVLPLKGADIRPSYLQRWPLVKNHRQLAYPLMPAAVETYDLREFDVVISSSYGPAKGVLTRPGQLHICYCHTPTRFLWEPGVDNRLPKHWLAERIATGLRIWDLQAAERPDVMLANSKNVQARISKYYRRQSEVLYPPVDVDRFTPELGAVEDYFLTSGRLVKQKQTELIIQAFKQNKRPLKIAGTGPEEARLKELAAGVGNIEFLGFVPDSELERLYAQCAAFVFAAEEDFGIVPVEAMSAGRPVIALGKGGALETVVEGKTGLFFAEPTPESLNSAIKQFDGAKWNSKVIRKQAAKFSRANFESGLHQIIDKNL